MYSLIVQGDRLKRTWDLMNRGDPASGQLPGVRVNVVPSRNIQLEQDKGLERAAATRAAAPLPPPPSALMQRPRRAASVPWTHAGKEDKEMDVEADLHQGAAGKEGLVADGDEDEISGEGGGVIEESRVCLSYKVRHCCH